MELVWRSLEVLPWWAWSVVANITIAAIEYLNRVGQFANPGQAFLRTGVFILIAQVGLFYAWRDSPKFMLAWATFFLGNCIVRVLSAQFFVGETLSLNVVFGVALITAGFFVIKGS